MVTVPFYPYCFYCLGEEAAMGIIVVSLPYTAYLWATLIAFCTMGINSFSKSFSF